MAKTKCTIKPAGAAALPGWGGPNRLHRTLFPHWAPPHVTLGQIFHGMMPFMAIQIVAMVLLYAFPQIGMWLPRVLYQ